MLVIASRSIEEWLTRSRSSNLLDRPRVITSMTLSLIWPILHLLKKHQPKHLRESVTHSWMFIWGKTLSCQRSEISQRLSNVAFGSKIKSRQCSRWKLKVSSLLQTEFHKRQANPWTKLPKEISLSKNKFCQRKFWKMIWCTRVTELKWKRATTLKMSLTKDW